MRTFSSRTWLIGLLLLAGATLIGRELSAQIPTVKGIGKVGSSNATTVAAPLSTLTTLVSVPAGGKSYVVTDIIVGNALATAATLDVIDQVAGGGPGSEIVIHSLPLVPKSSFNHTFGTGIEVAAGHDLRALVGGSGPIDVFVSGYFRK